MPRPKRIRKISCTPKCLKFISESKNKSKTILNYEEYESIRLMDYLRLTHDEAATMMNISRTTVTEIYDLARKKVAQALCEGNDLVIDGGDYEIISDQQRISNVTILKEGKNMKTRIAVTYENGQVYQHFGHTEAFKIYIIEDKKVLSSEVVSTNGQGHGQLAVFLLNNQVDLLICGGIGGGAINALTQARIKVLPGVTGGADEAVEAYLNQTLKFDLEAACSHHDHGDHHDCHCGDAHHEEHGHPECCCGDKK